MKKIKKLKFNKNSVEKLIKLSFIFTGICLIVFLLSGCINRTQRKVEGFTTPGEATMTIIDHDIPGNDDSDINNGSENSAADENTGETPESFIENRIENIPYYFVAIHNEPNNEPGGEKNIEESFNYLVEMMNRADEYNIKLTLMFSAQWEEYITKNPGRLAMLDEWKENGHEIVNDTGFGYTSCPDCNVLFGDTSPESGINEFISSGTVNGIERKWLSCSQIATEESLNQSIKTVEKLDSSVVYGVAAQSIKAQTPFFYAYLDYLHSLDPEGLNSKTLSAIIEKKLIPEKIISEAG
jgi:hypothetical protein